MIAVKFIRLDSNLAVYDYFTTEQVIETAITINKSVELGDAFEYSVSFSTLKINNAHGQEETYLSTSSMALYTIGVEVLKNGNCVFWGQLDNESVEYDEINEVISFTILDWYKFIVAYWKGKTIYSIGGMPIKEMLEKRLPSSIVEEVEILAPAEFLNYDTIVMSRLVGNRMGFPEFVKEILKRIGGYVYISADKKMRIVGRNYLYNTEINFNDLLLDGKCIRQELVLTNYDSVLVNYFYDDGRTQKRCWILIYADRTREERGYIYLTDLNNLSAIDGYKYLDLREKTQYINMVWGYGNNDHLEPLFPERSAFQIWADYRGFVNPHRLHKINVATTDLDLFYKSKYWNFQNLFVWEAKINLVDETSELTLMELID